MMYSYIYIDFNYVQWQEDMRTRRLEMLQGEGNDPGGILHFWISLDL